MNSNNHGRAKLTRSPETKVDYKGNVYIFRNMNKIELQELREVIQEDIDNINAQLADAKATLIKTGQYADIDWFNAAMVAKKIRGRIVQAIQIEQTKRNETEKNARPLSEYFVDVAKEFLVRDTFEDILSEANYRKEGELYDIESELTTGN